ncbi:MAG: hypothetical protein LBB46_04180, partial [Coriobacteriaceae bacterium]|nr:hypothetical protein [Coriobacteriaceae bacterium]
MAVSMREFTEDMCITFNERVYTIVECIHLSPIKGPALVRTKLRDIETGEVISNNFNAAAEVAFVETEKKAARFVGEDAGAYLFEALDESGPLKLA